MAFAEIISYFFRKPSFCSDKDLKPLNGLFLFMTRNGKKLALQGKIRIMGDGNKFPIDL
jgi:hypothetical protein